jgi:hypothetical protein
MMQLVYTFYESDSMLSVANLQLFLIPLFQSNFIILRATYFL